MGINEREPMPAGHTPASVESRAVHAPGGEAIRKPGEPGATANANQRDTAIIKLADSFGELAREAAQSLRDERETARIQKHQVRRWLETIAVALNEHLQDRGVSFDDVVNGDKTYSVERWWWDLYEGVFYELNAEIDPPVTLPRPVAEYARKREEQAKLEMTRSGDYVKNDDVNKSLRDLIDEGVIDQETASAIKNDLGLAGTSVDG